MRDLIRRLRPDCFDDIVALVALYRPGPLQSGMVEDFIERKHGDQAQQIDYLHPDLEPVLKATYGVILYQEQVMQIAQRLAGYSLGEADLLRRAMGKKKPEEMAKQRSVFMSGSERNGVDTRQASHIFDLMEKFAGYGFNKSHSAAYAVLSFQTAWLKANYPAAFMAAVLSAEMDDTDKLAGLIRDCRAEGLEILPPDVNDSGCAFEVRGEQAIRYGLGALKGLGRNAGDAIVALREDQPFAGLDDFCRRAEPARIGRRALEALAKAGAFDVFGARRPALLAALPDSIGRAEQSARARDSGQTDLFSAGDGDDTTPAETPIADCPDWGFAERLTAERESLGLYLSGHPCDQYRSDAPFVTSGSIASLLGGRKPNGSPESRAPAQRVTVAGLVSGMRKRGNRVTFDLDDGRDQLEVSLYTETFERCRHLLVAHGIVVVAGKLRYDDFIEGWRLTAEEVSDIDRLIEQRARRLVINWDLTNGGHADPAALRSLLEPFRPGRCDVSLFYQRPDAQARVRLGDAWAVRPTRELRERLSALLGNEHFRFIYDDAPA
jgi:DNA polymerase-3 subunit alpha